MRGLTFELGENAGEVEHAHAGVAGDDGERQRFGVTGGDRRLGAIDAAGVPRQAVGAEQRERRTRRRERLQQRARERLGPGGVAGAALAQRQSEKRLPVRQRTDERAGQRRGEALALHRVGRVGDREAAIARVLSSCAQENSSPGVVTNSECRRSRASRRACERGTHPIRRSSRHSRKPARARDRDAGRRAHGRNAAARRLRSRRPRQRSSSSHGRTMPSGCHLAGRHACSQENASLGRPGTARVRPCAHTCVSCHAGSIS